MAGIHQLVMQFGEDEAKRRVPEEWRDVVPIAAHVLADDAMKRAFSYSGFALTAFPYKQIPATDSWEKVGHHVTLVIDPGSIRVRKRTRRFGVPYGSYARLLMIYLQTEAVMTKSNVVPLGSSLRSFIEGRLRIGWGSETGERVLDQIHRLAACSMKFFWDLPGGGSRFEATHIIRAGMFGNISNSDEANGDQGRLWDDHVALDPAFVKHLLEHKVMLQDEAIRMLHNEPVALDAYVWLAYRMRAIRHEEPITWAALRGQFGPNYKETRQFKRRFEPCLRKAIAAYPNAMVDIRPEGVVLRPSDPPVPPRGA
ncbi:replication protein RepA [Azospirillum himalayense]|uniref:Replication protein RepA n=1 Tax=Azospirillum himalayense TaxID=654847 RepID=A0ABW0G8X2_9PROT